LKVYLHVNLTGELDRFAQSKVASGRFENASEVVRAGLPSLDRDERQYAAKLVASMAAIAEVDASGIAGGTCSTRSARSSTFRGLRVKRGRQVVFSRRAMADLYRIGAHGGRGSEGPA
jgi:putative addiction module CopG family antidote